MAVVYDNAPGLVSGTAVTNLTTAAFTITADANRVALIGLQTATDITGDTVTSACGGQAGAELYKAIQNLYVLVLHGVIGPSSGSQTASFAWSTSATVKVGAMTFSGAQQSDQFTGLQSATTAFNTNNLVLNITSAAGDMTASSVSSGLPLTSDQTQKLSGNLNADIGPGTGSTTHTWSNATTTRKHGAGVNIVQYVAGGNAYTASGALSSAGAVNRQLRLARTYAGAL